jgi:hypothetical protein
MIEVFYQLNEIFDLLQYGVVRRLLRVENSRGVGHGKSTVCSL